MAGTLENVYADALFEIAEEENSLDITMDELSGLAEIFDGNPELVKLMDVPTVSIQEKKKILSGIFENKVSQTVFNFLNVLADNGRIRYFIAISRRFREKYNDRNNILEVTACTTQPLSDRLKNKLTDKLASLSGKKIVLIEKIDSSIMGGIVLSYGNSRLDASVRMRLENMRRSINSIIA